MSDCPWLPRTNRARLLLREIISPPVSCYCPLRGHVLSRPVGNPVRGRVADIQRFLQRVARVVPRVPHVVGHRPAHASAPSPHHRLPPSSSTPASSVGWPPALGGEAHPLPRGGCAGVRPRGPSRGRALWRALGYARAEGRRGAAGRRPRAMQVAVQVQGLKAEGHPIFRAFFGLPVQRRAEGV